MYLIKEVIDLEKDLVRLFVEIPLIASLRPNCLGFYESFWTFQKNKKPPKSQKSEAH